ncbi:molybdopterin molybdotransferase MoeA [Hyphomonas johnsonii]|uniref:Molybdopterin molybdenumtransferase n=1 Tax=Hyphomonas johnsonii MHS-2 TaxID=1280950 RepID=A0A059FS74_9PROT|nr:molybdopterin molybdotransferase MoeA [Hyphomonas johnsonii]KCZ93371.1 molybdopterin biosynthesis protein MoeA [Hyphomonas johnsonii MHS-2]
MSGLISVDEALALLAKNALSLQAETVALDNALGTRLAAPVMARVSRPPASVSAMDGYAVRLADVRTVGARLRVTGDAPAGRPFKGAVGKGEAVRIFTGSVIPDGADHVVIQEDADRDNDALVCRDAYSSTEHVRKTGIDFAEGDELLAEGEFVTAAALSVAAAGNHGKLDIYRRPRVGILANGDELRAPGSALAPGQIVNSNPAGLGALIRQWGGEPVDLGVAQDTLMAIRERIDAASDIDIFLPIGGASVGDHDLMRPAFAGAGFTPVFEKIAVKPGKPTWFSTRDGQRVVGLPGNPASAFVCAHLFLKPLLTGAGQHALIKARTVSPLPAPGRRETYLRATVQVSPDGMLQVKAAPNQDSSLIRPFLLSNALIRRPAEASSVAAGELVDILPIGPLVPGLV